MDSKVVNERRRKIDRSYRKLPSNKRQKALSIRHLFVILRQFVYTAQAYRTKAIITKITNWCRICSASRLLVSYISAGAIYLGDTALRPPSTRPLNSRTRTPFSCVFSVKLWTGMYIFISGGRFKRCTDRVNLSTLCTKQVIISPKHPILFRHIS